MNKTFINGHKLKRKIISFFITLSEPKIGKVKMW